MVIGLGTDVVDVYRVKAAYDRHGSRLMDRVLAPGERDLCKTFEYKRTIEFLAGRFAAKEAIAKAAGCGLGKLQMNLVLVSLGARGLEVQFLHKTMIPELRGRWSVSISHTSSVAFATAILEADGQTLDE